MGVVGSGAGVAATSRTGGLLGQFHGKGTQ